MRLKRLATVLVASAIALAGCSVSDSQDQGSAGEKHLNVETVYKADTTDPHTVGNPYFLSSGAFETLTKVSQEGTLKPWLADSWDSQDMIHWTFALHDGVKFHNGKAMDAEAVKKSIEHAIQVNPAMAKSLPIESMSADGNTLSVVTTKPLATLPSAFAHYNAVITDVDDSGSVPVGTGAFTFTSLDIAQAGELEANPDYWDGKAKLDTATLTANEDANTRMMDLQSGQTDVIFRPSLENLDALNYDDIKVETVASSRVYELMYNYANPASGSLWSNEEFRKGFDALIDREGINSSILKGNGEVAVGPFSPSSPAAIDGQAPAFGVDKALEHFKNAGLSVDGGQVTKDGAPLNFTIATYTARAELPLIAQAIQDQAKKVGITLNIVTPDNIDEFLQAEPWDIATYALNTMTRGDGSYFVSSSYASDGALNYGKYNDAELNTMIDKFNTTIDQDERMKQVKEIGTYLQDHTVNSYIVFPHTSAALKTSVSGWVTPPNEHEYPLITKDLDIAS